MTRRDDASARQVRASAPDRSTWLSANAGSGKTRVLTDRVARLLLAGTQPQHILCLTYTKSAAAEMQNRLFLRLGSWAMLDDPTLRRGLAELGEEGPIDSGRLAQARRLFARAIETPGGLRIQTIHSFCASVLRRFPVEAGVTPGFAELDDRTARLLRETVMEELCLGPDRPAVDALAMIASEETDKILGWICRNSDCFSGPPDLACLSQRLRIPPDFDRARLMDEVWAEGDGELLQRLVPMLLDSGTNDARAGRLLARLRPEPGNPATLRDLELLEGVLLTGPGAKSPYTAKIGSFPTKGVAGGCAAPLMDGLQALMLRVEAARPRRLALIARDNAATIDRFARAFLPRYAAHKADRGWLDFDDLILRTAALLSDRSVAAWVLYRLDGGIDHILVDEAQDTSPAQWRVIERLAEEFTAGEGARGGTRTLFVVGDKKQSIYSFQGADLGAFDRMQAHFEQRHSGLPGGLQLMQLEHSFRSSPAILRLVDHTFDDRINRGLGGGPSHIAFNADMPGRVDLWPMIPASAAPDSADWFDPVDILTDQDAGVRLADRVAAQIRAMIGAGTTCLVREPGGAVVRPLHEGDFLILVQRRSPLFTQLILACKRHGLAIAGADRLKLGAELAVRDILALLRFLDLPEDDLSLAAALRSPLFGWTEAQLYRLAQPRPAGMPLWAALRRREDCPGTLAMIEDLGGQADFLRPYELIERILTRHGGRERLLARLGPEAEDGIDELLSQALGYERSSVPSLTGFLVWMQGDEIEVKRQPGAGARAVRVMTVHGAKGLEAPVVILPDTAARRDEQPEALMMALDRPMWTGAKEHMPQPMLEARDAEMRLKAEERVRLLYVAMTRAESWLIVCGAGEPGKQPQDSWHGLVRDGMIRAGAVEVPDGGEGVALRLVHGDWPAAQPGERIAAAEDGPLPGWIAGPAAAPVRAAAALAPSDLGGAKIIGGAGEGDGEEARLAGSRLHLLLQHLPDHPRESWADLATSLLTQAEEPALEAETEPLLAAAAAVIDAPELAPWLACGLREVEITGAPAALGGRQVHGMIDLLCIRPDRIMAIDYKTNAAVPERPEDTPEGILRQMGAYQALLAGLYPGRAVDVAVFWTATGTLMPLPAEMVRAALARYTIP